jgi:anti-sigma B factor antagonist
MMRPFELVCDIPQGEEGRYPEVHLRGCFDANGVPRLEGARTDLLESGNCHVILDLEELDYISSAGIGSIMAFFQALRSRDGSMVLLRPSRRVMDLLHILGFAKLSPIADTRASAGDLLNAARRA